jgi:hypothetical protein
MEAKRTPLKALAGHRRTIGRQGQSREDLSGKNAVRDGRGSNWSGSCEEEELRGHGQHPL